MEHRSPQQVLEDLEKQIGSLLHTANLKAIRIFEGPGRRKSHMTRADQTYLNLLMARELEKRTGQIRTLREKIERLKKMHRL